MAKIKAQAVAGTQWTAPYNGAQTEGDPVAIQKNMHRLRPRRSVCPHPKVLVHVLSRMSKGGLAEGEPEVAQHNV